MSTCQEVIRSAYRRSGITAAGVSLNASLSAIGLERLKGMYLQMLGDGLFGQLEDYFADDDYEAKEGQRIYNSVASTITIPDTVTDTCTGEVRAPIDGSIIVVIDPTTDPFTTSIQLYDALHGWMEVNDLAASDYAPLSGRFEEHLKNLLAMYLLSEHPIPPTPALTRACQTAKLSIASKYNSGTRTRPTPDFY